MYKIMFVFVLTLAFTSNVFATGYGWYVSSFNWNTFKEEINKQDFFSNESKLTLYKRQNKLDEYIWALATEPRIHTLKTNSLVIEESPMSSLEMYWPDALRHGNIALVKKGVVDNYFNYFSEGWPYKIISKDWRDAFDPYFVLSPSEVKKFYKQISKLNKNKYPDKYKDFLIHLEGVLLKTSADENRALVFFGHD